MRTIEIDFDVHKRIEMERTGFDDPPNAALRRLLGLGDPQARAASAAPQSGGAGAGARGWSGDGVHLPHGTQLRMSYSGRAHQGQIDGESWLVEDRRFTSPSGAAGGVALTKKGRHPRLDGWIYWEVKFPGSDEWERLHALREQAKRVSSLTLEDLGL